MPSARVATLNAAAGKLVATQGSGPNKGKLAAKFIPGGTVRGYAFVAKGGSTLNTAALQEASHRRGENCDAQGTASPPPRVLTSIRMRIRWSLAWSGTRRWGSTSSRSGGVNNGECDPNEYLVYTYEFEGGLALSDQVSFVAIVPIKEWWNSNEPHS